MNDADRCRLIAYLSDIRNSLCLIDDGCVALAMIDDLVNDMAEFVESL